MATNTCKCPLMNKDCFAKRGHRGVCFLLSEPALYSVGEDDDGGNTTDCKFRKMHQSMPKEWVPESDEEKAWAEKDLKKNAIVM